MHFRVTVISRGRPSSVFFKKDNTQCGPMVKTLALRSGVPGFKTRSDHSLNLFLVVHDSTSRPHLSIVNWFASGQLGLLTVVVVY